MQLLFFALVTSKIALLEVITSKHLDAENAGEAVDDASSEGRTCSRRDVSVAVAGACKGDTDEHVYENPHPQNDGEGRLHTRKEEDRQSACHDGRSEQRHDGL